MSSPTRFRQCGLTLKVILLLCAAKSALAQEAPPVRLPNRILVLIVNNQAISSDQVIRGLQLQLGPDQLEHWISSLPPQQVRERLYQRVQEAILEVVYGKLLYHHALMDLQENDNFEKVLEGAMNDQIRRFLLSYGGNEALARERLAEENISYDQVLEDMKENLVLGNFRNTYFTGNRNVTRWQLLQYYRNNLETEFTVQPSVSFQLIDIPHGDDPDAARAQADQVLERIADGEDFTTLVQSHSQGVRRDREGRWEDVNPQSLRESYQPVVLALQDVQDGQTTGIIEAQGRFFIAKRLAYQGAGTKPFDRVQSHIEKQIEQKRWIDYRDRLNRQLLESAVVGDMQAFTIGVTEQIYEQLQQS